MAVNAVTRNGERFMLAEQFTSAKDVIEAVENAIGLSLTGSLSAPDGVWLELANGGAVRYSTIERLEVNDE